MNKNTIRNLLVKIKRDGVEVLGSTNVTRSVGSIDLNKVGPMKCAKEIVEEIEETSATTIQVQNLEGFYRVTLFA